MLIYQFWCPNKVNMLERSIFLSSQERLSIYHLQGHSSQFISHEKYYCCQLKFLLTQQLLTELSRKLKVGPERQRRFGPVFQDVHTGMVAWLLLVHCFYTMQVEQSVYCGRWEHLSNSLKERWTRQKDLVGTSEYVQIDENSVFHKTFWERAKTISMVRVQSLSIPDKEPCYI